jgi:succinoglycan biosynthesis transport protein ExoP
MDADGERAPELQEYLAILRARKRTIVVVAGIVVGSALFFSSIQTPLYSANARVLLRTAPPTSSGFTTPVNRETEAELLSSQPVAARVQEDLALDLTTEQLLSALEVEPVATESEVLELSYTSPDPQRARDVANGFAEGYIDFKRDQARTAQQTRTRSIQTRIEAVQQQLLDLNDRITAATSSEDTGLATALETERSTLIARLGVLQQELSDFQSLQPVNLAGGEVIEPAVLPVDASSPNHVRNGLLAAFLGLALGVGLAFLRERLDKRFKGRMDVVRTLQMPVIATVPKMSVRRKRYTLAMQSDSKGYASEAYRNLRTSIDFLASEHDLKSVLITSPSAAEGKTITTANLGAALAQAGKRVVIVSADLRRPTVERYFGLTPDKGLSAWLLSSGDSDLNSLVRRTELPNLGIVSSGRIPPNPAELLSSPKLASLVAALEAGSDIVLFDSAPVVPVADPQIIASRVGATILVIDAEKTHRIAALHAKEELERVGGRILGTVINSFDPSTSPYYYESYYGYSGREPEPQFGNGGIRTRMARRQESKKSRPRR